jgi:glycerol-3-phosphate dehydrogenase
LAAHLPAREGLAAGWTGTTPLPGGEFDADELPAFTRRLARSYPFLSEAHALRLVRAYGTRATRVLGKAKSTADLGRQFGATLTEAEVRYLIDQEWAATAEDVLWRRSKLGLRLSGAEIGALEGWMRNTGPAPPAFGEPLLGENARREQG